MPSWYRPDPLTRDLIHLINARRHDHGDADVAIDTLQAMLEQDREQDLLTVMAALGEDMAEWVFDLLAEAARSALMARATDEEPTHAGLAALEQAPPGNLHEAAPVHSRSRPP